VLATGGLNPTLTVAVVGWGVLSLALLYRIGYVMGRIDSRLTEIERRAQAWDQALANGYRPRPPEDDGRGRWRPSGAPRD